MLMNYLYSLLILADSGNKVQRTPIVTGEKKKSTSDLIKLYKNLGKWLKSKAVHISAAKFTFLLHQPIIN